MSDLLPSSSPLDQASILPESQGLDASAIDRNLRAISQAEAVWKMPKLPDGVRLDLASAPGANHSAIGQFLHGLEADLSDDDTGGAPTFAAPAPALQVRGYGGQPLSPLATNGYQQAFSYVNQLRGLKPSETLDADATQRWKLRAIERGYMEAPADGVVDSTWSPDLTGIQRQMQYDDYDQSLRGNRFGAIPMTGNDERDGVLDILQKWTSPSGLMRAAVDLDLWWDTGQIDKEISSWGDKWRKVGDSSSPLDFAKNLLDAVTGPLDDIVVPALNMAMLFAGVGAATNFGRLALTGTRALEAAESFSFASSMYRVPKLGGLLESTVGRVFPAVQDVTGLGKASLVANKLMKGGATSQKVGGAMAAWRELPAVIGTRGLVQTGMKIGLVSQAEDTLLPNFQGKSLGDVPEIANAADRALRNAWISGPAEILFTPYTMFEAGTFTKGGLEAVKAAWSNLGTVRGRTAIGALGGATFAASTDGDAGDVVQDALLGGALGASAPLVGKGLERAGAITFRGRTVPYLSRAVKETGTALTMTNFEALASDQRMTSVFLGAMKKRLSPDEWSAFDQQITENGFLKAFARHVGVGDDAQSAAAVMTYVTLSAAIDRTASMQAGAGEKGAAWFYRYYLARNKLVNQVRHFSGDVDNAEVAWAIVSKESKTLHGARRRFDEYMAAIEQDPTSFAEALALHNEQAQLTMRQLLSPDNLPIDGIDLARMDDGFEGVGSVFNPEGQYQATLGNLRPLLDAGPTNGQAEGLMDYISNTLDSFGNWGQYQPLMDGLNGVVRDGLFADARLAPAISYMGTNAKLNLVESLPEWDDTMIDGLGSVVNQHVNDTLFLDKSMTIEQARLAGFHVNPMAAEVNPMRSKITLMREASPTKQQLRLHADELKRTISAFDGISKANRVVLEDGTRLIASEGFVDLATSQLNAQLQALGFAGDAGVEVRQLHRMMNYAKAKGFDVEGAPELVMRRYLDHLDGDARWQALGQRSKMLSKDETPLSGRSALEARRKELLAQANRTAAEIDGEHILAQLAATHGEQSDQYLRTKAMFDHVADQGYKVVYGQEFLMPQDLAETSGIFTDIHERHMNAMTLGNFFGRRHPAELAANVQVARQRSIARQLQKVWGHDVDPTDERIVHATDDLYRLVLDPEMQRNTQLIDDVTHQSVLDKVGTSIRTSGQPRSMQDLGLGRNRSRVMEKLQQVGWSEEESHAIWRGLREGRYAEWKDQGLYAIEAKLRRNNQILQVLHVLGGTENGGRLHRGALGGIGAVAGAKMAAATGTEEDPTDPLAVIAGAAGGALVGWGGAKTARYAAEALDHSEWARYGYMADWLASTRDRLRFSLSPFFDASRYTEAWLLGQIAAPARADDGARMVMPLNQSPRTLKKRLAKELGGHAPAEAKMQQISNEFIAASKGHFDPTQLEEAQRQFQDIGLLGFNPTKWMMSSFHYMRENGMPADKAYEAVRDMYTYGTRSRSAFEQSVNFVFFPFSFAKKTFTHAAQWVADDLTRSVLIHDSLKLYEVLDEKYDLGDLFEEHMPLLSRLKQLNTFAFGLSPGRLGGVNAPFIDAVVGDPFSDDPEKRGIIMNIFQPQGLSVNEVGGVSFEQLQKLGKRTLPVINDITYLAQDVKEQGHVLFDPAHKTRRAQATAGYAEWGEFSKGVRAALDNVGASWYDLYNNPGMAPLLAEYLTKKSELERQYPGWVESKLRGRGNQAQLDQEKELRLNTATYTPEEATPSDLAMAEFENLLAGAKAKLESFGVTDWDQMDPADFDQIKGVAMSIARETPGFKMVYQKFYAPQFGDIFTVVR